MAQTKSQDVHINTNKRQVAGTDAIICVLEEHETTLSPLFCWSPLEEERLLLSLWRAHAAEGLSVHTHQRKSSKRVITEQGLLLQRLSWQPAGRASSRQNHLHYRWTAPHAEGRAECSVRAPSAHNLAASCA